MRPSFLALVTAVAATSSATVPAPKSYFLSADPHVPLAVVDGASIRGISGHRCTSATRWGPVGSTWRALDAWGQVLATRTVVVADRYDVTGCNELAFRGDQPGSIYVSTSSPWTPSPSRAWAASAADRASFIALARAKAITNSSTYCSPGLQDAIYFDVGTTHHAVYGGIGVIIIARRDPSGWIVVTQTTNSPTVCTKPVAVFDMNGDGVPEIVLRENEAASWDEFVLERTSSGTWSTVATSPGGATI